MFKCGVKLVEKTNSGRYQLLPNKSRTYKWTSKQLYFYIFLLMYKYMSNLYMQCQNSIWINSGAEPMALANTQQSKWAVDERRGKPWHWWPIFPQVYLAATSALPNLLPEPCHFHWSAVERGWGVQISCQVLWPNLSLSLDQDQGGINWSNRFVDHQRFGWWCS